MLEALRSLTSLETLAVLLRYKPKYLAYILYKLEGIEKTTKYKRFRIPKKNGGFREINAPIDKLKRLQKNLNTIISQCISEIEFQRVLSKDGKSDKSNCHLSHGFTKGRSIVTNADKHIKKRWVINFDLKDFFPSIGFARVRGYFISNKDFKLHSKVATILAQISTFEDCLPQGAPTSPAISNLIASNLDIAMNKLCRAKRCTYTRYADDITNSTNLLEVPEDIGKIDENHDFVLSDEIHKIVFKSGFRINHKKTRIQYRRSRQEVTGLTVNEKVNISKKYWHSLKAQCDHFFKHGYAFENVTNPYKNRMEIRDITIKQLKGKLTHVCSIKRNSWLLSSDDKKIGNSIDSRPPREKQEWSDYFLNFLSPKVTQPARLYRKLLDFELLTNWDSPLLIYEGDTDKSYLQSALRSLAPAYSELYEDTIGLKFRFFNRTGVKRAFQGFNDGTGGFVSFFKEFETRIKHVPSSLIQKPIIFLLDNDAGSDKVIEAADTFLSKIGRSKIDRTKIINYFVNNIFIVLTPQTPTKSRTDIEDFLPDSSKSHGTRLFKRDNENGFDIKSNYGKAFLAYEILKKDPNIHDFTKIRPILDAISNIFSGKEKAELFLI